MFHKEHNSKYQTSSRELILGYNILRCILELYVSEIRFTLTNIPSFKYCWLKAYSQKALNLIIWYKNDSENAQNENFYSQSSCMINELLIM